MTKKSTDPAPRRVWIAVHRETGAASSINFDSQAEAEHHINCHLSAVGWKAVRFVALAAAETLNRKETEQ